MKNSHSSPINTLMNAFFWLILFPSILLSRLDFKMYICFYKTIMICNLYCEAYRIKIHVCLSPIILHITLFYSLNTALKYPRFIFSTPVTAALCLSHESHSSSALSVFENLDSGLRCAATWGKVNHAHLVKLVITLRFHITECPLVDS